MESYSASCYIENNDGQYHMECDMQADDKNVYSEYDGKDFAEGLNTLLDDIWAQMIAEPEPEPKEEPKELSLEDQVAYLTDMVNRLRDEKAELVNELNNLKFPKKEEDISKDDWRADPLKQKIDKLYEDFDKYSPYSFLKMYL